MGVSEGRVLWGTMIHFKNAGLFGHMTLCKTCQQKLVKTFPSIRLKSHYAVLGVKQNATKKEIKDAFIEITKKEHPDQNKSSKSSHERYLKILDAYDVLGKDEKRRNYDSELRATQGFRSTRNSPPGYSPGPPPGYSTGREGHYNRQFYEASQYQQYRSPYEAYEGSARRHGFSESARSRNMYNDDSAEFDPFANKSERRHKQKSSEERRLEKEHNEAYFDFKTRIYKVHGLLIVGPFMFFMFCIHFSRVSDGQPLTNTTVGTVLLVISTCYVILRLYLYRLIIGEQDSKQKSSEERRLEKEHNEAILISKREFTRPDGQSLTYMAVGIVLLLVMSTCYVMLYRLIVEEQVRAEAKKTVRHEGDIKGVKWFYYAFKGFVAIVVGIILYDTVFLIHWHYTNKYRQWTSTRLRDQIEKQKLDQEKSRMKASPLKSEYVKASPLKSEHDKASPLKSEHDKASPLKSEHDKASPLKSEHDKASPLKSEHDKASPFKSEHDKASPLKSEHDKASPLKSEHDKASPFKSEHDKASPFKSEHDKACPLKSEHDKASPFKNEHDKGSPFKNEHDKASILKSEQDEASPLKSEHDKGSPSTSEHVEAPPSELEYVKASPLKSDHDIASTLKSI